ncbi:DMT family transporter [Brevibacillus marinus]|uniref:DMT family transporter n=1 Tax=Brevibacillus marinus TaxID=2496837 RepID=UPI000F8234DB|nr:DMT family transporter [Brevibacillus marinus]
MNPSYLGSVYVLISAASFALIPIFALYAYQGGVSVSTLLFLRFLIAAGLFFSYLFLRKRERLNVTRQQLLQLLLLGGVCYTLQSILYFSSVAYIPASLAVLMFYTFPIFVALLAFLVDKEPLKRRTVLSILLAMSGLVLVLGTSFGEVAIGGVLLAVGSAVCNAIYIILGSRTVRHLSPLLMSGYVSLFAACSLFIVGLSTGGLSFSFAAGAWWAVLSVAVICTVIAMFSLYRGLSLVGPVRTAVLSMIEPVVTILFSALLLAEQLTWLQLLGGAIVLTGAFLIVVAREEAQVGQSG